MQSTLCRYFSFEFIDHEIFSPSPAVSPHVNDDRIFVPGSSPEFIEFSDSLGSHRRDVHVADFAIRRVRNFLDIICEPAAITKFIVVRDWLDGVDLGPLHGWFCVNRDAYFLPAAYLKIFVIVVRDFKLRPVDRQQVISLLNIKVRA